MPEALPGRGEPSAGRSAPRVVWVADGRLPDEFAVRAFRTAMSRIFASAGADVAVHDWTQADDPAHGQQAAATIEAAVAADVVVCETPFAARQAIAAGLPRARTWIYAMPDHVPASGEPYRLGEALLRSAARVCGLLTDTALSREALERALDDQPVTVLVLPPLPGPEAVGTVAPSEAGTPGAVAGDGPAEASPDVVHVVARLRRWVDFAAPAAAGGSDPDGVDRQPAWPEADSTPVDLGPGSPDAGRGEPESVAHDVIAATPAEVSPGSPVVGVFGYDQRFFRPLAQRLQVSGDVDVRIDEWPAPNERTKRSITLARLADVLVAEWARPNAAWLSHRKRPDQFLVVRVHRFEVESAYPAEIDIDRVDAVVHVGPAIGESIVKQLGWPAQKLVYIPNYADLHRFRRPKDAEARFTLGLVGAATLLKRLDLALDRLRALRADDPRFVLLVRTRMPWESKYTWRQAPQRDFWRRCLRRMDEDPLLRGAVRIDAHGADMARWFRGVGHVLSLSDAESFHLGLAEGMASGAVPVIRAWPGSEHLWSRTWVRASLDDAAQWVLQSADATTWSQRSQLAASEVVASFEPRRVVAAWRDLLARDVAAARAYFPDPLGGPPTS